MNADQMVNSPKPRPGQVGDICILLEPHPEQIMPLRLFQEKLSLQTGGKIHHTLHFTVQRFTLQSNEIEKNLFRNLQEVLTPIKPFPILTNNMVSYEHPYWHSRLLRWEILLTPTLIEFVKRIETGLVASGITPHFQSRYGFFPTMMTALENVPDMTLDSILDQYEFPLYLFTAHQVVISKILGLNEFEILGQFSLGDSAEPQIDFESIA